MTWEVALKLGRVSNLPTVWTNMLAAIVLAGGSVLDPRTVPLALALTLFYIGGMFLNDAFDAEIDAAERPERPIPSGAVSRMTVFASGFAMLGLAIVLLLGLGLGQDGGPGLWPAAGGLALAAAIVFYDWYHKGNVLSPVVMGVCRMLVYITAGLAFVVPLPGELLICALLLLCYIVGLTFIAKQETLGRVENLWPLLFLAAPMVYGVSLVFEAPTVGFFWIAFTTWIAVALWFVKRRAPGDIPRAVVSLIAGISLFDAVVIAGTGALGLAGVAVLGFLLTLALQKYISGT